MSRKKNILIMIVALCFSAFGVLFAYHYINNQVKAQTAQVQANAPTGPVALIKLVGIPQGLATGTIIDDTVIAPITVPEEVAFTADYVAWDNRDQVIGKKLSLDLPPSAAIRYSDVVDGAFKVFADLLKPGERAMTIPINPMNSIYGYLQPMDYIDLLLLEGKAKSALPLLNKIQVLATDIHLSPNYEQLDIPNTMGISTLTLKVSHKQAQTLALALTQGELVVLLRNSKDELAVPKAPVTAKAFKPAAPKKVQIIIGGQS